MRSSELASIEVNSAKGKFACFDAIRDLSAGLSRVSLWSAFAWDEIQQRYRRSYLGLIWIVLSYLFFVGAIAVFFGDFSQLGSTQFTVYVAVNYAIFMFLIGNVTDGCEVFRVAQTWIKSAPIPHSVHVFKSIARSFFVFLINMVVALILALIMGWTPSPVALLSIVAFVVILLNAIWVQMFLGYVAARFRDLTHLIQALTRILFFTTPILWVREERSGLVGLLADLNPFTHYLEVFSAPLLGSQPDPVSWMVVAAVTFFGFLLAFIAASYSHRRLPYWL